MGSDAYPVIEPPRAQPDGTFVIRVHRAPGETEEQPAKDKKTAWDLFRFMERASAMLLPRPTAPAPIRPTGRPSLLTPGVAQRLIGGFAKCMTYDKVAARAGISLRTLTRWLEDGRRALEVYEVSSDDYEEPETDRVHREFYLDAMAAEATKQENLIDIVTGPRSDPNWTRAMTFLERRWWRDFARRFAKDDDKPEPITVVFRRSEMRAVKGDSVERQTAEAPPIPAPLVAVK